MLANSLGWASFNVGIFFANIWPVIIILIGLSILSRGGFVAGLISVVILLAVLALVGAYAFNVSGLAGFGSWQGISLRDSETRQLQEYDISRDASTKQADISIRSGAGQINIGKGGESLVWGELDSDFATLDTNSSLKGNTQSVEIKTNGSWAGFGGHINDLNVYLNSDVPLKLSVDSGVAKLHADLSDIKVTEFDGHIGASSADLTIGDKVSSAINLDAGASSVKIHLPRTVGAKVTVQSGLSSRNFTDFKQTDKNTYESDNYNQAEKKVDITLRGGVSSLTIDWQ